MNLPILGLNIHGIKTYLLPCWTGFTKQWLKTLIKRREKGLLGLLGHSLLLRSQSRKKLEHQVGRETLKEHCSYIAVLYSHLHRDGATHSGLGHPTSTSVKTVCPRYGHKPVWSSQFLEVSSSHVTLGWVKLTIVPNQYRLILPRKKKQALPQTAGRGSSSISTVHAGHIWLFWGGEEGGLNWVFY